VVLQGPGYVAAPSRSLCERGLKVSATTSTVRRLEPSAAAQVRDCWRPSMLARRPFAMYLAANSACWRQRTKSWNSGRSQSLVAMRTVVTLTPDAVVRSSGRRPAGRQGSLG
jgi:hypothetical protein